MKRSFVKKKMKHKKITTLSSHIVKSNVLTELIKSASDRHKVALATEILVIRVP